MGKETDTKHAFFVGTTEERQKTQALMELLQSAVDFRVKATEMPQAIKDISSVLLVPGHASAAVTGTLELAPLQDSTDTMVFALAKPNTIVPVQKKDFATDQVVECKFKGKEGVGFSTFHFYRQHVSTMFQQAVSKMFQSYLDLFGIQ